MNRRFSKYIIIGGGLSGWVTAYNLQKRGETDIIVLESRDLIGGRIKTTNNIDLGATWFQGHHVHVHDLLDELKISKFSQYTKGKSILVYSSMAAAHEFESDQKAPAASRIAGGSSAMIHKLAEKSNANIHLETKVRSISEVGDHLIISTSKGDFEASYVISSIPPRVTQRIQFSPELPYEVMRAMDNTHTWMSNAIKVGMTFKKPFWRDKNYSGTIIGQVGPVTELYDHNCADNTIFTLMGFVNEALRDLSSEARKLKIINYLKTYLGNEISQHLTYEEKDWSQDKNTACDTIKSIYMSPKYGNPVFAKGYYRNKLIFSGAETSPVHGGYMDGAIYSGIRAAQYFTED